MDLHLYYAFKELAPSLGREMKEVSKREERYQGWLDSIFSG